MACPYKVTVAKFLICLIITKQNCLDTLSSLNYTVIFISLWRAVKVPHQVSWVTVQRVELQLNVQGGVSDVYKDYQRSNLPHMIFVQASSSWSCEAQYPFLGVQTALRCHREGKIHIVDNEPRMVFTDKTETTVSVKSCIRNR